MKNEKTSAKERRNLKRLGLKKSEFKISPLTEIEISIALKRENK